MPELIQSSLLQRDLLDEQNYTESLIAEAHELGLLSDEAISGIRERFNHLVLSQCEAFTGGKSASIRTERAQSMAESALFCVDACLRGMDDPLDALAMLQYHPMRRIHDLGQKIIRDRLRSAELMHMSELNRMPVAYNDCLTSTLRDGIAGFFKLYNPEYSAHEIHITADYPVLFYPEGWKGVDFIARYLDNISLEHRFLQLFNSDPVHRCLTLYSLRSGTTLHELHANLYLVVLASALRTFTGKAARSESLERAAVKLLDELECSSLPVWQYVIRTCREYSTDILRIQAVMDGRTLK